MDKLNKKAVVFTFIVVVLLAVIIISFLVNISNRGSLSKIQSTNIKVETLNSFVRNSYSTYIPDALRVSSHQAMLSLIEYEDENGYATDLIDYFKQVLATGYYNGIKQEKMFEDNLNYTLPSTLNELKKLAEQQGTIFDYSTINYNTLTITQPDNWHVNIGIELNYIIKDVNNEVSWTINNRDIIGSLSIDGYKDPLHLVEDEVSLEIVKVIYEDTDFSDIEVFNAHVENGYFTNHNDAPSFLQRLRGEFKNFVPDNKGIESIQDSAKYFNPGYSNVDYQFYSEIEGICVKDMPATFKLDQIHITYYQRQNC